MKINAITTVIYALLFFAMTANAAKILAVLEVTPSRDDIEMEISEYRHLTDELRTRARTSLPGDYTILTRDNIIQLLPPDEEDAKCLAEGCAVDIGRAIGAEYVTQSSIGKFGKMLTLTVELYESTSGNMLGSFVTESENIMGLLGTIRQEAPALFAKIEKDSSFQYVPQPVPDRQNIDPQISGTEKSGGNSIWVAIGLDVLGAAAIGIGLWQNSEADKLQKKYSELKDPDALQGAGEKAESAATRRNIFYIAGGALFAAGIGVHIWF